MAERFYTVPTDYVEQEVKKPVLFLAGPTWGRRLAGHGDRSNSSGCSPSYYANPRKEYPKGQYDSKSQRLETIIWNVPEQMVNYVLLQKEKEHFTRQGICSD